MPVMCQMCHVPLMFAMTNHMHHIWGGSFVETVDLKKLEDAVRSDLETIKEYILPILFGTYIVQQSAKAMTAILPILISPIFLVGLCR